MEDTRNAVQEQQWVEAIQAGDRRAFKALFQSYYEGLHAFVCSELQDPQAAEDIVQEIFLDVWRRRHRFAPRSVKSYLFGAARNKSIKQIESRQVRRAWAEDEKHRAPRKGRSPEDGLYHRELRRAMQASVEALPDRRRQVYVLSRRHGLTYREIAEAMDISPKTVDNQMVAALKFLRQRLRHFREEAVLDL